MIAAVKEAKEYLYSRCKTENKPEPVRVPELCRQKLLHYADSFQELARSLETEEPTGQCEDRREALDERRLLENKLLIRHNLCEMAQIMTHLADELIQCHPMEERYQKLLLHAMRAESIFANHFCYLTEQGDDTHAICMTLHTERKGGCPASDVADMLSVLLDRPLQLSATSPYLIGSQPHSFIFVEEAKYVVLTGFCKATKEGEQVSGDHYSILESEKGKMTLLLSDGTGSGERASRDSEKVLDLMEKLLEAGYEIKAAADMVNVAFYAGGKELCHPTLDVCDMNLYNGKCSFLKIGGVASFLKHGKSVEQIDQGTLPLGIFRNVETEKITKQLQDGDYVILMTDGVLDALPGEDYEEIMEQTISGMEEVGPGEIAERIMELALRSCEGHIQDDMTVLVGGIWENTAV